MLIEEKTVKLYNAVITRESHSEIFDAPVYTRMNKAIEILADKGINDINVISSNVSRDTISLEFYVEGEQDE